ncbi:hypothetical protein K449DRAFT_433083 [Hypoxylon sp. EC38]|nr:hypothetical protein K449DRAFT_433083 [Hypoxylon sp. EC38]
MTCHRFDLGSSPSSWLAVRRGSDRGVKRCWPGLAAPEQECSQWTIISKTRVSYFSLEESNLSSSLWLRDDLSQSLRDRSNDVALQAFHSGAVAREWCIEVPCSLFKSIAEIAPESSVQLHGKQSNKYGEFLGLDQSQDILYPQQHGAKELEQREKHSDFRGDYRRSSIGRVPRHKYNPAHGQAELRRPAMAPTTFRVSCDITFSQKLSPNRMQKDITASLCMVSAEATIRFKMF